MGLWGVEVKSRESRKVTPGNGKMLRLSQASLGEVKKGSEQICLFVKCGDQKLVLGTLSFDKFPQISFDLVFEKEFDLSHNWKNGSVFFTGFRAGQNVDEEYTFYTDSEDEDPFPLVRPESHVKQAVKPDANAANKKVKNLKVRDPKNNEKANQKVDSGGEDEEDESDQDSDEDDKFIMNNGLENSDNDKDIVAKDDESEDEETPQAEVSKKRPMESAKKTPVPVKKAKFDTPQKTVGKKGSGHIATPHPSKKAGKAAATDKDQAKQQTPRSGRDHSCKPCNRSFKTEDALQSHNRAKHCAK